MQKEELIQLHTFLLQLRTCIENMIENNNSQAFISYEKLNIGPHKIHKCKEEHKLAVFELSKEIANLLQDHSYPNFQRIYDSLEGICNQIRK